MTTSRPTSLLAITAAVEEQRRWWLVISILGDMLRQLPPKQRANYEARLYWILA